jgi:hypothetical protein
LDFGQETELCCCIAIVLAYNPKIAAVQVSKQVLENRDVVVQQYVRSLKGTYVAGSPSGASKDQRSGLLEEARQASLKCRWGWLGPRACRKAGHAYVLCILLRKARLKERR